jgi:GrpB-like predicted nucleotidyltransferase (UPF0157 family)
MDVPPTASLLAAIHQRVEIQPYDVRWPSRFESERDWLIRRFPNEFLAVEHFGSTAVPGLAAKPIIDVLAGVESMRVADELLPRLCEGGYDTSSEFNATLKDKRWLMRHADGKRTHHLHLVTYGEVVWRECLAFRDALRGDPALAARYGALKRELAALHGNDREAYTNAKTEFVQAVICSL